MDFDFNIIYDFCKVRNTGTAADNGTEDYPPRFKFLIELVTKLGIDYEIDTFEKGARFGGGGKNNLHNLILKGSTDKWFMAHHDIANHAIDNANDNSASVINCIALKTIRPDINIVIVDGEEGPYMGAGSGHFADRVNKGEIKCDWCLNIELSNAGGENFFIGNYDTPLSAKIEETFECAVMNTPFNDASILNRHNIDTALINPCPLRDSEGWEVVQLGLANCTDDEAKKFKEVYEEKKKKEEAENPKPKEPIGFKQQKSTKEEVEEEENPMLKYDGDKPTEEETTEENPTKKTRRGKKLRNKAIKNIKKRRDINEATYYDGFGDGDFADEIGGDGDFDPHTDPEYQEIEAFLKTAKKELTESMERATRVLGKKIQKPEDAVKALGELATTANEADDISNGIYHTYISHNDMKENQPDTSDKEYSEYYEEMKAVEEELIDWMEKAGKFLGREVKDPVKVDAELSKYVERGMDADDLVYDIGSLINELKQLEDDKESYLSLHVPGVDDYESDRYVEYEDDGGADAGGYQGGARIDSLDDDEDEDSFWNRVLGGRGSGSNRSSGSSWSGNSWWSGGYSNYWKPKKVEVEIGKVITQSQVDRILEDIPDNENLEDSNKDKFIYRDKPVVVEAGKMPTLDQMDTDILSRCHSPSDNVGYVVISDMEDFVGKVLAVIASFESPLPLSDEQKAEIERKKNAPKTTYGYQGGDQGDGGHGGGYTFWG